MFKVLQISSVCLFKALCCRPFIKEYLSSGYTAHGQGRPLWIQFLRVTHTDLCGLNLLKTKQSNTLQLVLTVSLIFFLLQSNNRKALSSQQHSNSQRINREG